jgi:long-chain acyl-CoA synthetase
MTQQVLDKDGWLRTGDIAFLHPNGAIKIVDRVRELAKLQNGEFISPLKLES